MKKRLITVVVLLSFVGLFSGCKEYDFKKSRMYFSYDNIAIFNEAVQVKTTTENRKVKLTSIHWKKQDLPATINDSFCFESSTLGETCEAKLTINFKAVFDTAGFDSYPDGKKVLDGTFQFSAKPDGSYDGQLLFENLIEGAVFKIEIVLDPPTKS